MPGPSRRGVSRIAGGIALAAALSVAAIVVWSALNRPAPAPATRLAEGPSLGDLTGYVGRVDLTARTVEVAENLLGQHPVTMSVTNDTSITVRGRPSGLGDLTKDLPVRALYEVRNDVKYVTSIVTDDARAPAPSAAPVETKSPTKTTPATPPAVAAAPPTARPVSPSPISTARAIDTDANDGSAAIDWLLTERHRR